MIVTILAYQNFVFVVVPFIVLFCFVLLYVEAYHGVLFVETRTSSLLLVKQIESKWIEVAFSQFINLTNRYLTSFDEMDYESSLCR